MIPCLKDGHVLQIIDNDFLEDTAKGPAVFGTGYFLDMKSVAEVYLPLSDDAQTLKNSDWEPEKASYADDLYAIGITVLLNLPLYRGKFNRLPSVMVDLKSMEAPVPLINSAFEESPQGAREITSGVGVALGPDGRCIRELEVSLLSFAIALP